MDAVDDLPHLEVHPLRAVSALGVELVADARGEAGSAGAHGLGRGVDAFGGRLGSLDDGVLLGCGELEPRATERAPAPRLAASVV
jgi:hypothetical protein